MQMEEIATLVDNIINENFVFNSEEKPSSNQSLLETGILDSYSVLTFVMSLEEKFNISIEDEELVPDNLDSIKKAAIFVNNKLAGS